MSTRPKRVAIIGGGIAGVTAAWQLARLAHEGAAIECTLFEASGRLGGTVETVRRDGFVVETGPDGWVTEKPWARELALDLGLAEELICSLDATRVTYILHGNTLVPLPDGMRMMVPTDLGTLEGSPLFTEAARQAYAAEPGRAEELRALAPDEDESVAGFVCRHFGAEVLAKVGAPLLSGVFGGNVETLSVRAVMPNFVAMERQHGSLIVAMQAALSARAGRPAQPIFTSLRSGTGTLVERMAEAIPAAWVRFRTRVTELARSDGQWVVHTREGGEPFDEVLLAVPAHVAGPLLAAQSPRSAELLRVHESSAIIAAFAFKETFELPRGFGFLVPAGEANALLAGTFVDQKYPDRVPEGCRLLRAFFGGEAEPANDRRSDEQLATLALAEFQKIVGALPEPAFHVVRRWPRSLPQYAVGHLERMEELTALSREHAGLHLLGNPYRGVGLPDLIRDARATARGLIQ